MAKQLAYVKGKLLRWARESLQLTVEEAAAQLAVDVPRLVAWEHGQEFPTVPQLREMARVYRRPLAAFFLPEPPKDFSVPHDFRRLPGEPALRPSAELLVELRRAFYRRQLAIELADEVNESPRRFVGSVKLGENSVEVAVRIRRLLGITLHFQMQWRDEYEALNAWKSAIESLGVLVFHFSKVAVDEVRGFSISEVPFPVIGVNGSDSPNGRVFSLIHEFCHLLLGNGGSCNFHDTQVTSPDQRVEAYCNSLAAETLVPGDSLRADSDVRGATAASTWADDQLTALARKYRVSREVILRRLLTLNKTSDAFYRAKRMEWIDAARNRVEEKGGFLTVPRSAIRTLGQPFARIVLGAYHREQITTSDLAEFLGVRIKHVGEIESLLGGPNVLTGGDQ